ncbi:MAG: metal-dependent phosphohydrolase [Treponema sp.]|nr:metal-dependent phosphohydrolase [Treponema sp.]
MAEKDTVTPASKILTNPDGSGVNRAYIDIMLQDDTPVLCVNRGTQKKRLMPFKVMYGNNTNFWEKGGDWEYYFMGEDLAKVKEKAVTKTGAWDSIPVKKKPWEKEEHSSPQGFGDDYTAIAALSAAEKIQYLNNNKQKLNTLLAQKNKDKEVVTEALVDTTRDAAIINHAVLEEAMRMGDDEAKKTTQDLVDTTHEMIKSSTQLFSEDVFNNELMNTLVQKSNGTIVQHMTRVYLNGIAFLSYYNNLVSSSSAINKIRVSFNTKYRNYYRTLLSHMPIEDVILERIFYGGMRAITPDLFFNWAVGFLIHDIGKASAVQYHEGEAAYDRSIVIEHVKQGYTSIMNKTNYPREASLITGYHHEYYGDPEGYGYFRAYLESYRKANPNVKQDYCISYELAPILDFHALAYFPAKVLEIIDVYDSVTDPHRVYRKALTPEQAITMMREEFIDKRLKVDPILFDIFAAFIKEKHK